MCSTLFITFGVSVVEGLAGGVLKNYRLNDLASPSEIDESDASMQLLPDSLVALKQRALEDFTEDDDIYEEFPTDFDQCQEDNISLDFQWKLQRPLWTTWLAKCFWSAFSMVVLCGFLIGAVTVALMFVDINTANVCYDTPWDTIPVVVQRVRVAAGVFEGWVLQFFHIIIMLFVFGFRLIDRLHLLNINLIVAFTDSVYRLFLQLFDSYSWPGMTFPLNAISVGVMVFNSYIIARHYELNLKSRIILTFQLGSQFMLGIITLYTTVYLLIPWFIQLDPIPQAVVAASSPICGAVVKTISRIAIQNISNVNHPGTSYALLITVYAASPLVYRTLQAQIEEFYLFVLLSAAHALVGFLERLSVVLRDHFYIWFYKRVLKREHFHSYVGAMRTPRTQRLVADITICNIIHEITALIFTNAFVQLYALQVGTYENRIPVQKFEIVDDFVIRTLIALLIEFIFTVFSIFMLTWFMNIPILRVWRKNWKSLLLTNLFTLAILVIYTTEYLIKVVDSKYEHLKEKTNSTSCDPSRLLFFS